MWKLFERLFDILLPRKERAVRIEQYASLPLSPRIHEACGASIITLCSYREKAVEDTIRALKYDGNAHACQLLASSLAEYLREEIASQHLFSQKPVLLVPMPLHASREKERGFNQIEKVLQKLPAEFQNGTLSRFSSDLIRTRATAPQTRLSRHERLKNVDGAFALARESDIHNTHIFLIDDVTTTGATLTEAAKPLTRAGADVTLLALAHA